MDRQDVRRRATIATAVAAASTPSTLGSPPCAVIETTLGAGALDATLAIAAAIGHEVVEIRGGTLDEREASRHGETRLRAIRALRTAAMPLFLITDADACPPRALRALLAAIRKESAGSASFATLATVDETAGGAIAAIAEGLGTSEMSIRRFRLA